MKKNLAKVMAVGMAMTILLGTAAFANDTALISDLPAEKNEAVVDVAEMSMFISQGGKVVSIEESETDGVLIVTLENDMGGLRFAVASDTIIVDRKTGEYKLADQIEEGMEVLVIYNLNSPMGLSMPPFLGDVAAVVINADAGSVSVGRFDKDLTDWQNMLKLNISDETSIQNVQGSRIRLSADDVKGKDALVFYDITTRSIPAQTTPSFVLILNEEDADAQSVPLREAAEAQGFEVVWQGKDKPILAEKDGMSMEFVLNDNAYIVNGEVRYAAMEAELIDGVTYVSGEIFE